MNTSKLILSLGLLSLASAMGTPAHASSNVFQNGDFETGDVSAWVTEGAPSVVSADAASGLYAVKLGGADAISAQWLVGLAVSDITELSFDIRHAGGPFSSVWMGYSDGSYASTIVDGLFESDGWLHYDLVSELSAGKVLTSLTLYGTSPEATYVDNLTLLTQTPAVPEPAAAMLMMAGLAVVGLVGQRLRHPRS